MSKPNHVVENTVFVRNVNFKSTGAVLGKAFEQFGKIKGVRIGTTKYRGETVSLGFAFIEYEDKASAAKTLESINKEHPFQVDGRELRVFPARAPRPRKGDTIFVLGIPKGTTEQMLKDAFEKYGPKEIRMKKEDDGNKKGFAFVQFETSEAQEAAVQENRSGIKINGGDSKVRFARPLRRFPLRRGPPAKKGPRRAKKDAPAE